MNCLCLPAFRGVRPENPSRERVQSLDDAVPCLFIQSQGNVCHSHCNNFYYLELQQSDKEEEELPGYQWHLHFVYTIL